MKKKNVVKKDVREKKTLRRSTIRPIRRAVIKKQEIVESVDTPVVEKEQPKKQKKNKPAPVVKQENIIEENNQ